MSRSLPILLIAGLVLSGCASSTGNDSSSSDPGKAAEELDLKATENTGVIRGVVVDLTVTPIAGALISVRSASLTRLTNTTDKGAFGMDALEPGTYFVKATKAGFIESQTTVEVVAGVSDPEVKRITLEPDGTAVKPYFLPVVNKGYIECSATAVFYSVAACSVPNDLEGCAEFDLCALTTDVFLFNNVVDRMPTYMQSEMVWEHTTELGAEMALIWSQSCGDKNNGLLCDPAQTEGTSPLLLSSNATILQDLFVNLPEEGSTTDYIIRVFNSDLDQTKPPPGTTQDVCVNTLFLGEPCARRGLGVTSEQRFEIYTHVFYGYQPPEWRFTSNTPVPPPPK